MKGVKGLRRKDREVKDFSEIIRIIESCDCCRLGFVDNREAYIVPLNFGYEIKGSDLTLYFHSAKEGRKIDLVSKQETVSFESVPPAQPVVCTPGNNPLLPAGADGASNATAFCTSFTGRC